MGEGVCYVCVFCAMVRVCIVSVVYVDIGNMKVLCVKWILMVFSSVLLVFKLFEVLRGLKLMFCLMKVMSPPPFLCVLSVLCVVYCGIVGVL